MDIDHRAMVSVAHIIQPHKDFLCVHVQLFHVTYMYKLKMTTVHIHFKPFYGFVELAIA